MARNTLDPYACGPACCEPACDTVPAVIITVGEPEQPPNPCSHLPIAYDAEHGCFYLWTENSGWFEASGVAVAGDSPETKTNVPTNDHWVVKVCTTAEEIYNSRNTALALSSAFQLKLSQTYGAALTVDLSGLDSYVDGLSINSSGVLTLTQTEGKETKTVNLSSVFAMQDRYLVSAAISGTNLMLKVGTSASAITQTFTIPLKAEAVVYDDADWFLATDAPTVQAALDQLSNFLSTAFGDDLIILNNPTFLIRTTGSAAPDITSQADLATHPFNSFDAVRTFIAKSYIVGSITIDARGSYASAGSFTAANMKNAASVVIKGDAADYNALVLAVDPSSTVGNCIGVNGVKVTLRDLTLHIPQKDTEAGRFGGVLANNAVVLLDGTVQITGNYKRTAGTQNAASSIFWAYSGGQINTGDAKIIFSMSQTGEPFGHSLQAAFYSAESGTITIAPNSEFMFNTNLVVEDFIRANQGAIISAYMSDKPVPVISGPGKIHCTNVWHLANLASYVSSYFAEEFSAAYWPTASAYQSTFAPYCVVNGTMGLDL